MIVVTGACGFIGTHLVEALRRRSTEPIRMFDAQAPSAVPAGVEIVRGRVEDPESVSAAMRGVRAVIHLAAKVQPDSRDLSAMSRINVEGTRVVYSSAVAANCEVFLQMSSAGVYGAPRATRPFSEDDVVKPITPYQRTKWEAEEVLRSLPAGRTTMNIVRPAGIYGPGSHLELPRYKRLLRQRWSVELAGGVVTHPTYVSDVVEALVAMLDRPAPHGTVLNVGGEKPLLVQELDALISAALDVPRRRITLPSAVMKPLSKAATPVLARLGRERPLLAGIAAGERFTSAVDDSRFRAMYPGVRVVPLRDGIGNHIAWARAHDLL